MNFSMIRYILGCVLKIEAAFMLLPCVTAMIYKETEGLVYLGVMAVSLLLGQLMSFRKPENTVFYLDTTEYFWCISFCIDWRNSFFHRCIV